MMVFVVLVTAGIVLSVIPTDFDPATRVKIWLAGKGL